MMGIGVERASAPAGIEPLLEAPPAERPARGGVLPGPLRTAYGGDLAIGLRADRPTLVANFVSTLDGVVSYATPEAAGGGEISGFFERDRFVMGLLRSLADAVVIGAGTLRAAGGGAWTPASVHPDRATEFAALRRRLGLGRNPATVIVTASGSIDVGHPGIVGTDADVLLVTTPAGAAALRGQPIPSHVEVASVPTERVEPRALLDVLAARGARMVLCEGGPHLFGQLLAAALVDELFLTLAPQLAGRSAATPRLSLVEGRAFDVAGAPWAELVSLRRAGEHLFARYRISGPRRSS